MTLRKTQNSVLILTTLGIYIGLVLVGASPGVFAQQAAMSRSFDLQDETELSEDLDRKPKDQSGVNRDRSETDLLISSLSDSADSAINFISLDDLVASVGYFPAAAPQSPAIIASVLTDTTQTTDFSDSQAVYSTHSRHGFADLDHLIPVSNRARAALAL